MDTQCLSSDFTLKHIALIGTKCHFRETLFSKTIKNLTNYFGDSVQTLDSLTKTSATTSTYQLKRTDLKCIRSRKLTTYHQLMYGFRAFIGNHTFQIKHMTYRGKLGRNTRAS